MVQRVGYWWYLFECGHAAIADDYNPKRGQRETAWCPKCWEHEQRAPVAK